MADTQLFIGVDIGRSTRLALVDPAGRICRQERVLTETKSGRALVSGLINSVKQIRATAELPVAAIGVGLPGLVDFRTQQIEVLTNFVNITSIDLHGEVERALGLPVIFDNDANMAAYGEWQCGAICGAQNIAYITLGRGIGSAFILSGQLQRGAQGYAGEFGHTKVGAELLECSCGSNGCLETVASGPNIVRRTRERLFTDPKFTASTLAARMKQKITCEDVVKAAVAGDELARSVLAETAHFLGIAVANVVNLLNVDRVVLGGPVMAAGEFLLDAIRDEVAQQTFAPLYAACKILIGKLGDDAGIIGGALMARDLTKSA